MTHTQIIKYFGTQAQAARLLGFSIETLRKWRLHGVPPRTQELIQTRTRGHLKAGARK